MPSEKSVDYFIESSSKLLEAFPSTTTLSITYANTLKKSKPSKAEGKEVDSKKATNQVTFKCYEPRSGKCVKYSTFKIKELSRLMTFIGPRGVLVTKPNKKRKHEEVEEEKEDSIVSSTVTEHKAGLASIMSNVKFDVEVAATPVAISTPQPEEKDAASTINTVTASSASKNKKKKKKGKK